MSVEAISAAAIEAAAPSSQEVKATPTVEANTAEALVPTPQPLPETDKFAAKFAALSRKEKEMRMAAQQMKQKEMEWQKKVQEAEERSKQYVNFEESLKSNPLKFLQEKGITYEQLTEMILNESNPTPELVTKRMKEELESKFNKELEALKKRFEDKETSEKEQLYGKAKQDYIDETKALIDSSEQYELIKINNAHAMVYDVAEEVYNQNYQNFIETYGREPSREENTLLIPDRQMVLDAVETDLEAEASKVLQAKKILNKLQKPEPTPVKQAAPTLSNAQASQAVTQGERKLSNDDSLKEAAKLLRWME